MSRSSFAPVPVLGFCAVVCTAFVSQPASAQTLAERVAAVRAAGAAADQNSFLDSKQLHGYAIGRYASGDTRAGDALVERALNDLGRGAYFRRWQQADVFRRYGAVMNPGLRDRLADQIARDSYQGGSTSNHRIMNAAGRYLASEVLSPGSFTGSSFNEADPTARDYLLRVQQEYVRDGEPEYDSPTYAVFYGGAFKSLADLATDPVVRRSSRLAYEAYVGGDAGDYLRGHHLSASNRDTTPRDRQAPAANSDVQSYLAFGDVPDAEQIRFSETWAAMNQTVGEPVPEIFARIAADRDEAYTHQERGNTSGRIIGQTAFVDRGYGLYSQIESTAFRTDGLDQGHRWSVKWDASDNGQSGGINALSTFFIKHPSSRSFVKSGLTPDAAVLQDGQRLVGVFDRAAGDPPIYGITPAGYSASIDNSSGGRIYLHYGEVMIGVWLSEAFDWNRGDTEIRTALERGGMVIETANPRDFSGTAQQQLQAFKDSLLANEIVGEEVDGVYRLNYRPVAGAELQIDTREQRFVGGAPVRAEDFPMLDNPWMQQEAGGRFLRVEHEGDRRVYDWDLLTIADDPAGRGLQARYDFSGDTADGVRDNDASPYTAVTLDASGDRSVASFGRSDRLDLPTGLVGTDGGTLIQDVRLDGLAGDQQLLAGVLAEAGTEADWSLTVDEEGHLVLLAGGDRYATDDAVLRADTWQQIALVWAVDRLLEVYVDGVLVLDESLAGADADFFGRFGFGADPDAANGFAGGLDSVLLFDAALRGDELRSFLVPEPGLALAAALGGLTFLRRRSRS